MATMVGCSSCGLLFIRTPPLQPKSPSVVLATAGKGTRRALSLFLLLNWIPSPSPAAAAHIPDFEEIPYSGGVKALQLRIGSGTVPDDGDKVAIHYYARLAAKQGWRFDSTYDHKDETGHSWNPSSCQINESRRHTTSCHPTFSGISKHLTGAPPTKRIFLCFKYRTLN
uniref:Uncharacterized protein n=1 Tax=Kalanchoe fedtschenkoi TaxID=63787 RepID=A0A7N0TK41_KALFE